MCGLYGQALRVCEILVSEDQFYDTTKKVLHMLDSYHGGGKFEKSAWVAATVIRGQARHILNLEKKIRELAALLDSGA